MSRRWSIAGVYGLPQGLSQAKDARALHGAADAALYAAKEVGRNQVALSPNEEMGERLGRKDSQLLREALDDLFRKYDTVRGV